MRPRNPATRRSSSTWTMTLLRCRAKTLTNFQVHLHPFCGMPKSSPNQVAVYQSQQRQLQQQQLQPQLKQPLRTDQTTQRMTMLKRQPSSRRIPKCLLQRRRRPNKRHHRKFSSHLHHQPNPQRLCCKRNPKMWQLLQKHLRKPNPTRSTLSKRVRPRPRRPHWVLQMPSRLPATPRRLPKNWPLPSPLLQSPRLLRWPLAKKRWSPNRSRHRPQPPPLCLCNRWPLPALRAVFQMLFSARALPLLPSTAIHPHRIITNRCHLNRST